ncbi:rap guanine nucleotide exchange factor 2-like [Sycon ciliatum]|uniref:rap guanine nucleotide exchange factor 2-like n=1 Tax=Sycon ciliatum TaxID=27933 RepID=UPI0031F603B7
MDHSRGTYPSGSAGAAGSGSGHHNGATAAAAMNGDLSRSAPGVRNQLLEAQLGQASSSLGCLSGKFLETPEINICEMGSLEDLDILEELEGLEEVCVDSEPEDGDDTSDVSSQYSDSFASIQDLLSKAPEKRSADDLDVIMDYIQHLPAFANMTLPVREKLCALMRLQTYERARTVLVRSGEEVDRWWVVFGGAVELVRESYEPAVFHLGEAFGVSRAHKKKVIQAGSLVTRGTETLLLSVAAEQFHDVFAQSEQATVEVVEDGALVMVTEYRKTGKTEWGQVVVRGARAKLVAHLVVGDYDPAYAEDFLLTYRTFMTATELAELLEQLFLHAELRDRVARVVLLWANNHIEDFNGSVEMIGFLRTFRRQLEETNFLGELRLLTIAVQSKGTFPLVEHAGGDSDAPHDQQHVAGRSRLAPQQHAHQNGISGHLSSSSGALNAVGGGGVGGAADSSPRSSTLFGRRLHGFAKRYASTSNMRSASMRVASAPHARKTSLSVPMNSSPAGGGGGSSSASVVAASANRPSRPTSPSSLLPLSVIKLYRHDHQHRYLTVGAATTALDLVRMGVRQFEMPDSEESFSLCRITVSQQGVVQQTRLPDAFANLPAELRPMSRFYLKSNKTTTNLVHGSSLVTDIMHDGACDLLSLDTRDVARVVTLQSFLTFRRISGAEYVNYIWDLNGNGSGSGGKDLPGGKEQSDFQRFSSTTNNEMFWVVTEIVSEPSMQQRVRKIKFFLKVAKLCRSLRNFNTMFAITSGLSYGAVTRLRQTWEKLGARDIKSIEEMQILMNPSRNMLTYRSMVSSVSAPIVPFFPVVTKDLTFIYLGNDDRIDGLINFEKLRMMAREIRHINGFHASSYDVTRMLRDPKDKLTDRDVRKIYEQWFSMRRVEHYLKDLNIISDEAELDAMAQKAEPPPSVRNTSGSTLEIR